jgi:hypothetical protein
MYVQPVLKSLVLGIIQQDHPEMLFESLEYGHSKPIDGIVVVSETEDAVDVDDGSSHRISLWAIAARVIISSAVASGAL